MQWNDLATGRVRRVACGLLPSGMLSIATLSSAMLSGPVRSTGPETASRVTSVADTGDFATTAPGYAQYATPLWCVAAVTNALEVSQNTLAAQAVQRLGIRRVEDDTVPAAARAVARTCGARFTVANTAQANLPDLFQLALYMGADTMATTTLTTLVAQAETPRAKADRLLWGIQTYAAQPGRVAMAEAAAAQLDALGAAFWQIQATAHETLRARATAYLDRARLQHELDQLTMVTGSHVAELTGFEPLWDAYKEFVRVTWLVAPDSLPAAAQRLQTAFRPPAMQQMLQTLCHLPFHYCAPPLTVTPLEQIPLTQLVTAVLASQGMVVPEPAPAPPLTADFWFPSPQGGMQSGTQGGTHGAASDTLQPAAGQVSLIYHWSNSSHSCGDFNLCNEDMLFLKALLTRYGKDVSVTMLVDADSTTALSVPAPPRDVAASYQWLFQTYLGLPVRVAVRMQHVAQQFPPPDGRLFFGATGYHDAYMAHAVTLVNRQQQILLAVGGPTSGAGGIGDEHAGTLTLMLGRTLGAVEAHR